MNYRYGVPAWGLAALLLTLPVRASARTSCSGHGSSNPPGQLVRQAFASLRAGLTIMEQERALPPARPAREAWAMEADIPADTMFEILRLQSHAEVVTDDLGALPTADGKRGFDHVHIRGGRGTGTAFMIDGMQVTNLTFGGMAVSVAPSGVAEMIVMEGGHNPHWFQPEAFVDVLLQVVNEENGSD